MKKVLITQSNYIPWKGYFDNIAQSDILVIYDDVQYTKRDWRNRNYIKTEQGKKWLTIPVEVKGKYFQSINNTIISDLKWSDNHCSQLKHYYSKTPHFKEFYPWIESLYKQSNFKSLTEINVHFIKSICSFFGINTILLDSRDFNLEEGKTERLVSICKELGATEYLTGPSAKNYMDESLFVCENIKVKYFDYSGYKEYTQLFPPFEHNVCIWDLIFNTGNNAKNYLLHVK